MYPLFLNLQDRTVLVVGGGPVGRRKALGLLEAGSFVRLVCLESQPFDFTHPRLTWLTEPFTSNHLDAVSLVISAGPPSLNRQVTREAHERGLWVGSATEPGHGDFVVPATVRRGDLVIAIGTGGAAPTLARALRLRLESELDEAYASWVSLLGEMRELALQKVPDPISRRELLENWSQLSWLDRLRCEGVTAVQKAMLVELENHSR